jgi:hypothetical protein
VDGIETLGLSGDRETCCMGVVDGENTWIKSASKRHDYIGNV